MTPDLSVVIVHYHTPALLKNCLRSVFEHTKLKLEVIVVDNDPEPDFSDDLKKEFPDIIFIPNSSNEGFGRASNQGMNLATGQKILLINPDTIVHDQTLERSCDYLDAHPDVGMIGCQITNEDGKYEPSFFPFMKNSLSNYFLTSNPIAFKVFGISKRFALPSAPIRVGDISGAFILLRSEVFTRTQGFDPQFFLFCEETEWCRERVSKNFKIVFFPMARVTHLGGKSAPDSLMYKQQKLSLGLLWFKKGLVSFIGFLFLTAINQLTNLLILPFLRRKSRSAVWTEFITFISVFPAYLFRIPSLGSKEMLRIGEFS